MPTTYVLGVGPGLGAAISRRFARARSADRDVSTMLSPDAIAETYWHLHAQHPTSWTHEIDLRPSVEKF